MCLRPPSSLRRKTSTIWNENAFSPEEWISAPSAVGPGRVKTPTPDLRVERLLD
jgi:hypothetical protein